MVSTDDPEVKRKLMEDPDYILVKRFDYSLEKFSQRYPDGAEDHIVARALGISEEQLREESDTIIRKLRKRMGVQIDGDELDADGPEPDDLP